jgi:16S rRNA (guanine1207-N2)-methyltransferase
MSPSRPYTLAVEFSANLSGTEIRYVSKPGLPEWERVPAAAALQVGYASLPATGKVALLGCHNGAAAAALALDSPGCEMWLADTNLIALQMTAETLQRNQVSNARISEAASLLPEQAGSFDMVLVLLPKGRKLARRWLAEAFGLLGPEGVLYLSGANDEGIQPVIRDATALFGEEATLLAYKGGNRIARVARTAARMAALKTDPGDIPEWYTEPGIAAGTWHEFDAVIPGGELRLCSLPGIFSYDRIDDGTRLLLESVHLGTGGSVLDLGCGYGVIGLCAALAGAGHVDLLDVNLLAIAAAGRNLLHHGAKNAQAIASDGLGAVAGGHYDLILSNPPFHAGQAVDYQMAEAFIQQSVGVLNPGGRLIFVANHFIRYERLMAGLFRHVEVLGEDQRYRVILASNTT